MGLAAQPARGEEDETAVSGAQSEEDERTVEVRIRPLEEPDLDVADSIMRIAFGTYLKAPDPFNVFGDSDYVHTRFRAAPECAFAAERGGEIVGSNFATRWGSFGFFGPLTVRTDLWDQGIAGRLIEPVLELFERWQLPLTGLFTFPESPKHVGLYQKFGFWPQALTPVLEKPVGPHHDPGDYAVYSALGADEQEVALEDCRRVAEAVHPGLDLEREIVAVASQRMGETILLEDRAGLVGFAVCHCGQATEAGSGACAVKFGAVLPGDGAAARFERLLGACESLAAERGLSRLTAGMNSSRHLAYRALLERGYRPFLNGLTMLRPNEPGFDRSGSFTIGDLR